MKAANPVLHILRMAALAAPMKALLTALLTTLLTACASSRLADSAPLHALPPGALLLLGEQHDANDHQQWAALVVRTLADQGQLAAVVLEMVEQGHDTRRMPANSDEARVREQLAWNARGWPWEQYGPLVMHAVRAGVPVVGGNLPRQDMAAAMRDESLDGAIDPGARAQLAQDIRDGHCGLMPESRIPAMTRIQIARDRAMARTLSELAEPQRHVLLLAGGQHVRRTLGVPQHLTAALSPKTRVVLMLSGDQGDAPTDVDHIWRGAAVPARDHCAELRQQMGR